MILVEWRIVQYRAYRILEVSGHGSGLKRTVNNLAPSDWNVSRTDPGPIVNVWGSLSYS